jgi:hypothetical protein
MQLDTAKTIEKLGKQISGSLKEADKAINRNVTIDFSPVKQWIKENASGTEREGLERLFDKETYALLQDMDGTLEGLQRIKQNLYQKGYDTNANSYTNKFYKQLTRRVKETIESEVDDLAKAGRLEKTVAGQIKQLNADEGDLIQMQKIFTRQAAKEGAADPVKVAMQMLRTSGGFGVPLLAGMYTDNPMLGLAAGLLGAKATTPKGRMQLSGAISVGADGMAKLDPMVQALSRMGIDPNAIARALVSATSQ